MDESLLHKYTGRKLESDPSTLSALDSDITDDLGCFGWLRGVKERAVMLELRKKDGHILAIGYGWLERMEFDPSKGITLHLVGQRIRVTGRNLNAESRPLVRLFEGLTRHRVPWIREADRATQLESREGATVVEAIEW